MYICKGSSPFTKIWLVELRFEKERKSEPIKKIRVLILNVLFIFFPSHSRHPFYLNPQRTYISIKVIDIIHQKLLFNILFCISFSFIFLFFFFLIFSFIILISYMPYHGHGTFIARLFLFFFFSLYSFNSKHIE